MTKGKTSILVVDDEKSIRRLLCEKLTSQGYDCREADSAKQATEELSRHIYGVLLLDIRMPGKSGSDLLPEVKTSYPDIAIIMVTATDDASIAIQCMKLGAYDYIIKPFNLEAVIFSVDRALEKRRLELEIKEYHQHLEERVTEQANKIRSNFLNTIVTLIYALEAKDKYTSGHSQRVADIAVAIAKDMDLSQDIIEKARVAGLLHDIGKIGVNESILNKSGRLNDDEFRHVQQHPLVGEKILTPVANDEDVLQAIRNHHERYDGSGYPDGLKGDQIPRLAVIIAVADAYEAMTSERPYRPALSKDNAIGEIERCSVTQFNPVVVKSFLKTIRSSPKL